MKPPMKKTVWISLLALAVVVRAADAPKINSTNAPAGSPRQSDSSRRSAAETEAAAGTNEPPAAKAEAGKIPDATHKPVLTTNTVTIAGRRVTYVAETGMLPLLKPDGNSDASVFYVAYTRAGQTESRRRVRSRFVSTAVPARRPCGCTLARSARAA